MNFVLYLKLHHQSFLDELDCLEQLIQTQGKEAIPTIKEMVQKILSAVEKHAKIEERFLFSTLELELRNEGGKTIPLSDYEHEDLDEMRNSALLVGTSCKPAVLLLETGKFIHCLREHMKKEEEVLFPLAESIMGRDQMEVLGKKAEREIQQTGLNPFPSAASRIPFRA